MTIQTMVSSFVLALFMILPDGGLADAGVLCASPLGHLRLRERCRRHEQAVDLRQLTADADPVPLRSWEVTAPAPDGTEGLESVAAAGDTGALVGVDPCRLVDTRTGTTSSLPGVDIGALADHEIRTYVIPPFCGIAETATALSINLAVVPGPASGFVSVGPGDSIPAFPPGPSFASINFVGGGPALSNSLVVPVDDDGRISVYAARNADVIIDTNGYFAPDSARRVYVPGSGTPVQNGDALKEAVTGISNSPAGSLWEIEVGPGVFDLGNAGVAVQRPAVLRGAGRTTTLVTCNCANGPVLHVMEPGSEVRSLRVDNTNTAPISTDGIQLNSADDSRLADLHVETSGNHGVAVLSSVDVVLDDVTIEANDRGVDFSSGSTGTIRNSAVSSASASSVHSRGDVVIRHSTLDAANQAAINVFPTDAATIEVSHSTLRNDGSATMLLGQSSTFHLRHSFLTVVTASVGATLSCRGVSSAAGFATDSCS